METVAQSSESRRVGDPDSFVFTEDSKQKRAVQDIRDKVQDLKVVSRAKVTMNRIYCAAYHPEVSKDIIFFGGISINSTLTFFVPSLIPNVLSRQTWSARNLGRTSTPGRGGR